MVELNLNWDNQKAAGDLQRKGRWGGKKQAGGPEAKRQNAMRLRAATRAKADEEEVR